MTEVGCPKCGRPLTDDDNHALLGEGVERHCRPLTSRSCTWITHACGAVVDHRHPSRWLDHSNTKEKP